MSLEAKITKQCNRLFKSVRAKHKDFYFQKISDRFTSGIPDYYILYRGQCAWVELKRDGADARPLQEYTLRSLRAAGAMTLSTSQFIEVEGFIFMLMQEVSAIH